ncbi:regulating synaptic membrane exocytosis protein 2-like [Chelonus insularis]|uniref:regulating synaptic membrane exocytosis protein 2-like n=1 Tax=Chelonus insularis TaxID=460826 RepID=UPI0015887DD1|nr:regulating synaptic membrane exocytosis protein 2-like [Chelonus insularis]
MRWMILAITSHITCICMSMNSSSESNTRFMETKTKLEEMKYSKIGNYKKYGRKKQDEVQILEETIRARSEKHKKAGIELDATCDICMKTKFADGIGHTCNYCKIRCCARCGGKVTLRSNKLLM